MKQVVDARLRGGGSTFAPFKYHWWELDLDCGHTMEKRIRWLPPLDGSRPSRGYAAQHRGVSLTRLPPEPKRAKCDVCEPSHRKREWF
jgi:hypothetical protein